MIDWTDSNNLAMLHEAFKDAERLTAHQFKENVCQMTNRYGQQECPLCVMKKEVLESLRRQEMNKHAGGPQQAPKSPL